MKDRQLMAGYTALNLIDISQTNKIFHDDNYHEINPILTKGNFIPVMIGTNLLLYYLADTFPRFRTKLLLFGCTVKTGLVIHNKSIGL